MKILLALTLVIGIPAISLAGDWAQKDPAALAAEARKTSLELKKEASEFMARAMAENRKLSAEEAKYVELAGDESLALEKSAEAWGKNQKRLAVKYREDAMEICKKRGPLAEKVYSCKTEEKAGKEMSGAKPVAQDIKAQKLAEIERQQAELEAKKKALLNEAAKD